MQFTNTFLEQETAGLLRMLKSEVVTPKGYVVGRVLDVRVNEKTFTFEGIVVKGKLRLYISKDFIQSISADAVMLKDELICLLKGRTVVSYEGEILGVIYQIDQLENQNHFETLYVRPKLFFGKRKMVKPSQIKSIGTSVILKNGTKLDNV
jgi:sporulation protein YlmC with PRC-barrel domain